VYLRWTMGPTDSGWQYCGWNIDDVEIWAIDSGAETCDDGVQNQGEDRIDCGGPCPPCDCLSDGACADGLFCNGDETCDAYGHCQPGSGPCPGQRCRESDDTCGACLCGDLNGDGATVDLQDFSQFSVCFGLRAPTPQCTAEFFPCADFNQDGWVNLTDFSTFQVLFGTVNSNSPPDCSP
jgi:hypothetical protein